MNLLNLKQFWQELWALFHPGVPAPLPARLEYPITPAEVGALLPASTEHYYLWDNSYWCVSLEDWKRIFDDVRRGLPAYVAEKFDCEDFAVVVTARVLERYELNTCGFAAGQSPLGYHGFNLFVAPDGDGFKLHVLEPQTGEIDPPGYLPDQIIFG